MNNLPAEQRASRLIAFAITRQKTSMEGYLQLLEDYEVSSDFRDTVHNVAEGFDIVVHPESGKAYGLLISAKGVDSMVAPNLGLFDKMLGLDEGNFPTSSALREKVQMRRAVLVLLHVAVSATLFPTAESLESDETLHERSASARTVVDVLKNLQDKVEDDNGDFFDPAFLDSSHALNEIADERTEVKRKSGHSKLELAQALMKRYAEQGLLVPVDKNADYPIYKPTMLYLVQLRSRTFTIVQTMRELLDSDKPLMEGVA
ncbi:hypothetical protein [Vibrio neptunius]|uniref:Uncharacterized protein n=1 Tax=Vibrio neptunius TaxID=170651 RepID=A0ABS3A3C2_9VIBR|nr:hypothetical protein [Vibrio neptunius]MBN3493785.1 hypothetical protein [Vibrio neptunius]MBN3516281.1 hypothetical protein [Vibrio neptunius]MBN3550226.1 hypothetical protein [Vibrio neptunius]MBN3578510.1 hypothetical protein [Vibrio neptunius]MCH9872175.1 hypothetical protein [Vibrio neptunius]